MVGGLVVKRILYGVQATGNGHITRARALVPWLRQMGFEVDVLISGRACDKLFGMEIFGHYRTRRGFTFTLVEGSVSPWHTLFNADIKTFWRDVRNLNVHDYDIILSDFEPVTAWAAKLRHRPCIGIGHQYSFHYKIPQQPFHYASRFLLRWFAPAAVTLGMHWDSFGMPILPPMLEARQPHRATLPNCYLVYLPFDNIGSVLKFLALFPDKKFIFYADVDSPSHLEHVQLKPYSRSGFSDDLAQVEGVVCGAGFELPSEALSLGKKILVKPLAGQFEQGSNALALSMLAHAHTMDTLDSAVMRAFLDAPAVVPVNYPDVAQAVAQWLKQGCVEPIKNLSDRLWACTVLDNPLVLGLVLAHQLTL